MLTAKIRAIHEASRGTYGPPRILAELRDEHDIRTSRKRVARLMRAAGLKGVDRRKNQAKPKPNPKRPVFDDLLGRNFTTTAPNRTWIADITQHMTAEGWLYLSVVLDLFSRKVVGWAMGDHLRGELVICALEMAVLTRNPERGLVHHSDHGSQYTSLAFGKHLKDAGILGSMGTVGEALDNAVVESFFASLQTEVLDRYGWESRAQLRTAIFEYLEVFYNRQRRHSALGYLTPAEFERRFEHGVLEPDSATLEVFR